MRLQRSRVVTITRPRTSERMKTKDRKVTPLPQHQSSFRNCENSVRKSEDRLGYPEKNGSFWVIILVPRRSNSHHISGQRHRVHTKNNVWKKHVENKSVRGIYFECPNNAHSAVFSPFSEKCLCLLYRGYGVPACELRLLPVCFLLRSIVLGF